MSNRPITAKDVKKKCLTEEQYKELIEEENEQNIQACIKAFQERLQDYPKFYSTAQNWSRHFGSGAYDGVGQGDCSFYKPAVQNAMMDYIKSLGFKASRYDDGKIQITLF